MELRGNNAKEIAQALELVHPNGVAADAKLRHQIDSVTGRIAGRQEAQQQGGLP